MDFKILAKKAAKKGIKEIELFVHKKNGTEIAIYEGILEKSSIYQTEVMAIRGVYNGKLGLYYTEDSNADLDFILDSIIENTSFQNNEEPYFIYSGSKGYPTVYKEIENFSKYGLDKKIGLCLELEKLILRSDPKITRCPGVSYGEEKIEITIQNTNGLNVVKNDEYFYLVGEAIAEQDDDLKSEADYHIGKNLEEVNLEELAKKIAKRTVDSLGGKSVMSQKYPIVLENRVASNLLGAFASIFSAEDAYKNLTFLKGMEGKKVFGENITIIDDPLFEKSFHKTTFDDEGVASIKTNVIEDGVFRTFLHNLKTAKMFNTESTSNGYKASVSENVSVDVTNLYLKSENNSFEELIKKCGNGLLITNISGLHAGINPTTGVFNLQASGFKIEYGVIKDAVTLIVLSGDLKTLFNNVILIGDDYYIGLTDAISPSLFIKELNISGI